MKRTKLFLVGLLSAFLFSNLAYAGEKTSVDFIKLINDKNFRFEATSLNAQRGFYKSLVGDNYYLEVNGEDTKAYLPYVGRAFSSSTDGAVKFENKTIEAETKFKKKEKDKYDQIYLSYKVKGNNETYDVSISVGKTGMATVSVRSNLRQSCNYNGKIYPLKD